MENCLGQNFYICDYRRMENLETGQAWVCNAINEMPPLMCIVGRIDQTASEERIVSVRIKPHPEAEKIGWPIVDHVPIMGSAFENSSLRLGTDKVAVTDSFEEGYKIWKEAFDGGKAGAFSLTISEVYAAIVKTKTDGKNVS